MMLIRFQRVCLILIVSTLISGFFFTESMAEEDSLTLLNSP